MKALWLTLAGGFALLALVSKKGAEAAEGGDTLPEIIPIGGSTRERIVSLALAYLGEWEQADEDMREQILADIWERATGSTEGLRQGWPWSGAFVVAVVNSAEPGALPMTARHTTYARAALTGTGFQIHDARTYRNVQPGDIVLKPRPGGLETFADIGRPEGFDAHADIVVSETPSAVVAVGGNKAGGNVGQEAYQRNADGSLTSPAIAILTLKTG